MMNKKFVRKVGWWISTSSLGITLAATVHITTVHATDVRLLAQVKTHYALSQLKTRVKESLTKSSLTLSGAAALKKGLSLVAKAKTASEHRLAFEYLNYAAKQGLPEAMFQCALMYLDNEYTPDDDERAMSLLEQASEQGHKQAGIALNYIEYADGGIGC